MEVKYLLLSSASHSDDTNHQDLWVHLMNIVLNDELIGASSISQIVGESPQRLAFCAVNRDSKRTFLF